MIGIIPAYKTETGAFISSYEYNFLSDAQRDMCTPIKLLTEDVTKEEYAEKKLSEYKDKLKAEIELLLYPPGMSVNTSSTNCTLRMMLALINKS